MGICRQVRRFALGVACASGLVAGAGMAVAPGAALATVACANITGSGSTLQVEQQEKWITEVKTNKAISGTGANECTAAPTIEYDLLTGTGSGMGLEEFGIQESGGKFELIPTLSSNGTKLDAYVGTDDPPTEAQLAHTKGGAGSKTAETTALTVPTVAAPIAIIIHLPAECTLSSEANVTNAHLSTVFADETITWSTLLGAAVSGSKCSEKPMVDVRSDSSGTSFALKQYLCQVNPSLWGKVTKSEECESGKEFVTDASKWPNETITPEVPLLKHTKGENLGSPGEAEAVSEEAGSIGYVNLANAAADKFELSKGSLFWANIEGESGTEFADPLVNASTANCPTTYSFPTGVQAEAEKGFWTKVHLAQKGTKGAYPICTFTYDIGWENYKTTALEADYSSKGTEVGATAKAYFEYMTKTGSKGQSKLAGDYAPLPTGLNSVQEIAEKIGKKIG